MRVNIPSAGCVNIPATKAGIAHDRPLLPAALGALLLAFHARDPIGLAVAFLALLWELVFLWVTTEVASLARALSVLAAGLVLLGAWWVLRRRLTAGGRSAP